jgi:hypothetical protein
LGGVDGPQGEELALEGPDRLFLLPGGRAIGRRTTAPAKEVGVGAQDLGRRRTWRARVLEVADATFAVGTLWTPHDVLAQEPAKFLAVEGLTETAQAQLTEAGG